MIEERDRWKREDYSECQSHVCDDDGQNENSIQNIMHVINAQREHRSHLMSR